MNETELPYVFISVKAPIVYFKFRKGAELGFPEIKELIAYAEKLSQRKPYVTFSDVREEINITEEGKRFLSNESNMPLFRGTAALVKNKMFSFGANFMNQFNKRTYPFKAFTNKEKAILWLKKLPLD